ncbi:MAG: DUF424 family protein [DPANN group archaeon]|nr:DUF424 family protein [DPANN group archaeon]
MSFIVKKHKAESSKIILAIIDEELAGKKITEGNKVLDLNSSFYKGEKKRKEEVLDLIKEAGCLNVVGNKIVDLLKKEKLIDKTLKIGGVPYAQAVF